MSPWSALPVELKRLILELVARNNLRNARSLRLVSTDINILVLPIIFHNILIEHVADLVNVTRTIAPPPSLIDKLKNKALAPPRLLSTYNVSSVALLLQESLPSIETALASVGPVFSNLRYLAITSRNISSNAFWLRENRVKPTHIMLLHHGSPRPVNWRDRIFSRTTHIFTCSLDSHGLSTLVDLSNLTHIAVSTHSELSADEIGYIASKFEWLLDPDTLPPLEALVLALQYFPRPPAKRVCGDVIVNPSAYERYQTLLTRWQTRLEYCLNSSKFYILPDPLYPRDEWDRWIHSDAPDIWERAASYREKCPNSMAFEPRPAEVERHIGHWLNVLELQLLHAHDDDEGLSLTEEQSSRILSFAKVDWEIDLIERPGYRESERLDPGEAGEFVHMFGL